MKTEKTYIAKNRKAFHDYFVEDRIEAGIELTGTARTRRSCATASS